MTARVIAFATLLAAVLRTARAGLRGALATALGAVMLASAAPAIAGTVTCPAGTPASVQCFEMTLANANSGTMSIAELLENPAATSLAGTGYVHNWTAVGFTPSYTGQFVFGQNASPVDTVLILFQGSFDPLNPAGGVLVGFNDDKATHDDSGFGFGDVIPTDCSGAPVYCPQVRVTVTSGQLYTLVASTYGPDVPLDLPQTFYTTAPGAFSGSGGGGGGGNVPEPHSLALALAALAGMGMTSRRRRQT